MVEIEDIPMWAVGQGNIGHIVLRDVHGWVHTACLTLTPSYGRQKERPQRICRKCRAALPKLQPLTAKG